MLDFDLFTRVIDEAGPSLGRIDFFNYGEAFLHKRAVEMCEYIKTRFPHIYLYTSTNGLALKEESARRLVHTGIDEVTFSIDGASQETYERYRQRGTLDVALANLRADGRTRSAGRPRRARHQLALHPLHLERQRRGDAARAGAGGRDRRRSPDAGRSPTTRRTRSRAGSCPGTPDYERIRYEVWDTNNLGNAIPGAMPRARIDVGRDAARSADHRPARTAPCSVRTRVHNLSTRPFPREASYGRRLVRLGAQLCDASGTVVIRDYARAWLPHTIDGGAQADVVIEVPAPETPGRYQLKFDLVSEGVDWFEACGSQTTLKPFRVL